jgi:hypothetical protein
MSVQTRAIAIGMAGPVIQALGFLWLMAHLLLSHLHAPLDPRHLFFEGGFLMMLAGLAVSIVCIPVALEVARASLEEVEVYVFPDPEGATVGRPRRQAAEAVE